MPNPAIKAIVPSQSQAVSVTEGASVPMLIESAGSKFTKRFVEFLVANYRNKNTRMAYYRALDRFFAWCDVQGVQEMHQLEPTIIAAYIEQACPELRREKLNDPQHPAKATLQDTAQKQHLAAIRMLFDYFITGGLMEMNPASAVKGPKVVIKQGKTPVLSAEEAAELIDAIDVSKMSGMRDRALIALMLYTFTRIGAAVQMNIEDVFVQDYSYSIRRHEKGGKYETFPLHHLAEQFVLAYMDASGIREQRGSPLFRSVDRHGRLTDTRMHQNDALRMVKRRARKVGLNPELCNHSFRGTGITEYVRNGGSVENARRMAGHATARTTEIYVRVLDDIKREEVERIRIPFRSA